jgi:succinate-acetate transporter protein
MCSTLLYCITGPLGLAAFAATTFMLSCYNADLLVSTTANIVLPMAFWYGGFAQAAAGLWEYATNNTFGATAFVSYGAFWLSFATVSEFWAPTGYASTQDIESAVGIYLLAWTIFTAYMFIGSLRMSYSLIAVFGLLEITFALLTAGRFNLTPTAATNLIKAGGWFGIFTAFAAWVCISQNNVVLVISLMNC